MNSKRWILAALVCVMALAAFACGRKDDGSIRIGLIAELTGDIPAVGVSCRNAAEMAVAELNAAGGIPLAGGARPVRLVIQDDANQPEQAAAAMQRLLDREDVLAVVGPNASVGAVPAAAVAEAGRTVMVTPWSTNPKTTLDATSGAPKKYVFRACYTDEFQGKVLADFVRSRLQLRNVAVLYDVASEAPKSQAELFAASFRASGGVISVMETYTSGDRDFSAQLTKIKAAAPEIVFLPAYYNDVPLVAQQAKRLGITAPFLGSDAWSSPQLIELSRGAVEGSYFANHYSADARDTVVAAFVAAYRARYGEAPDDVAALTYDAVKLLAEAIRGAGRVDREAVRAALAGVTDFRGVTGGMRFAAGKGDPQKSAVILRIEGNRFAWFATVDPQ